MDKPNSTSEQVMDDGLQEWITPALVIEDVKEVTRGGTGPYPIIGTEDQISSFYHS